MAAENDLQAALDFLFHTTSDGVVITDAGGRVSRVNPALGQMLRIPLEDCLGREPKEAFKQRDLVDLLIGRGEQSREVRLPKKRLAVGMATDLLDGGRIAVLHDVTEQHDVESRREALVSAIAHDLRNPISALGGFADLVARSGELNEEQDKFLTRVRQTADKLNKLILPLVELAWIEAGMPLRHEPCRLGVLIYEAVGRLAEMAREKKITIAISTQEPMPLVMGDPERLLQVVYNLLHNAVLYSPREVTVAVHAFEHGEEVMCTVADPGPGIREGDLEQIFDRMYRSSDESVRDLPGSGLGLTLARVIVERHGGRIWAESEYGRGSTFTFVLPSAQ